MWHCIINFCMNIKKSLMIVFIAWYHPWWTKIAKLQGVLFFWGKKCRQEPFFYPSYCKIIHLKANRNFTLLVSSSLDFVCAYLMLNQHLDFSRHHRWNFTLDYSINLPGHLLNWFLDLIGVGGYYIFTIFVVAVIVIFASKQYTW